MAYTKWFALWCFVALLVACGDDGSSAENTGQPVGPSGDHVSWNDSILGLNGCTVKREGEIGLSPKDSTYYVCVHLMDPEQGLDRYEWEKAQEIDFIRRDEKCDSENIGQIIAGIDTVTNKYYCTANGWADFMSWNFGIPKEFHFNPDIDYGTMTDNRDGKTYKTVTIGSQTWMAENLAYETLYSFEYDWPIDDMKMGLFYDWDYAVYGGLNKRDICPNGWHLPSKSEWSQLIDYVGGREFAFNLKSKNYWDYESGVTRGVDRYGFSAVPAGYREDGQNYIQQGYSLAAFWTSDGYDGGETYAYACMMSSGSDKITMPTELIYSYLNVRCVKD